VGDGKGEDGRILERQWGGVVGVGEQGEDGEYLVGRVMEGG